MRIVGIDGGATSTKCLLVDEHGHVLGHGKGGPSNHLHGERGICRLRNALEKILRSVLSGEGPLQVDSLCFGKTGIREERDSQQSQLVEDVVREYLDTKYLHVCGDMPIALASASLGQPGVLVYAGTGANTYGVDEVGKEVWVGGWGYLIDDEGAGYDIGWQALKWAFRAEDGRGEPTLITERLKRHLRCASMAEMREKVYRNDALPRPEIAALTRLVCDAAEDGDMVAREILAHAGRTLAAMAAVAIRKLGKAEQMVTVYPAGGSFRAGSWILQPFAESLRRSIPQVHIKSPQFPPVVGAVFLALRPLGLFLKQPFLDNLRCGVKEIGWAD